ncbi:TetR/AcrR family transcriptional regulator [Corynebacterium epidermidicanis]|uniref:Transcriptional regulator, TetR family n=1 Tax=Corynebacterium epidermidicanis TaxID=1050174 RepID=A0A0G3GPY3_9CORY|nr:TetR/AcrR family transcriptional regulator [Corynebacterium epidermidicanis]AKK03261.1 transcriptional regulator, TetR family [Corynebacterium epidermidicanis]
MRADALARRQRIISAARELLTTMPDMASLEAVAKRAGVGIATLYRNFPDRTSLLSTIVEELFGQISALQTETLANMPTEPAAAWEHYARGLIDLGLAPLASSYTAEMVANFHPDMVRLRDAVLSANDEIITLAQKSGQVSEHVTGAFFIRGLLSVARPHHKSVFHLDDEFTNTLVGVFLCGLKNFKS